MRDEDFERIYAEHAADLFSFLAYRVGNRSLAEDLVADTFERVYRARARFDPRKSREKTWVYAIALNLVRDQARRQSTEVRALELAGRGAPDETVGPEEASGDRDAVRRAMETLSAEERDAIALRFGADLSLKEIAKVTGESMTTAEGRVYRALRKMRDVM